MESEKIKKLIVIDGFVFSKVLYIYLLKIKKKNQYKKGINKN